ncbi:hypothetical protein [Nonomuraea cavernae]|uniref:Transcriptional regulator TetR C-terminal Proteobacteria type domain-containing protein n=1 Tax=Nonomuraea cavernae TaxID=2045107 RepID=A0A917Z6G3_9ACTN|nr:hypothetical protein [Nonomuraea cavernae]MCA2189180.1 hypothetical protein [Nonomuraea cavernae]GGO76407.1 hypothetical protein GCM10012289_53700 [Nonomuraea cavernae]
MATSHVDPHQRSQDARRRVLEMALSVRNERPGGSVDHFLALLQYRLPFWLSVLHDLAHRVGQGRVADNLIPIVRAGIDYYGEVQSAALPAFTSPHVTVRFREALRDHGLGPMAEIVPLASYLEAEQRAGRVVAGVDPVATARLLLAGCFHHAYIAMFVGDEAVPPPDAAAEQIVRELRLEPGGQPA